jgi:hypothetical protein
MTRQSKATADPPFEFAQGRLFGDDNKKSKSRGKTKAKAKAKADPPPAAKNDN